MAKLTKRRKHTRAKATVRARKPAGAAAAQRKMKRVAPKTADETAFLESLIVHGQAVRARPDGTLPPGATHELVEDARGEVRAVRRRFSVL